MTRIALKINCAKFFRDVRNVGLHKEEKKDMPRKSRFLVCPWDRKLTVCWAEVSGKEARDGLEHHNPYNREMSESRSQNFAKKMAERKWLLTGEPLIKDKKGNYVDGQNRLRGVDISGVPLRTLVVTGVDQQVFHVVGGGNPKRTADDRLYCKGYRFGRRGSGMLTVAYSGLSLHRYGHEDEAQKLFEIASQLEEGMKFVNRHFPRKKHLAAAEIRSVFVRAYHSRPQTDRRKLRRACELLLEDNPTPRTAAEVTVCTLRKWILKNRGAEGIRSSVGARETYSRVERMLYGYLEDQELTSCIRTQQELFPLPHEMEAEKEVKKLEQQKGQRHWLVPLEIGAKSLKSLGVDIKKLGRVLLPKDRLMPKFRTGDKICLYANKKGVVADAKVRTFRSGAMACEVRLQDHKLYDDKPVAVTPELCRKLDAFRSGVCDQSAPSILVRSARPVSPHDFAVLVGNSKKGG